MKKTVLSIIILTLLLSILAGCSDKTTTTTRTTIETNNEQTETPEQQKVTVPKGSPNIDIIGDLFVPETLTIKVGTTVAWTNKDATAHSVSFKEEAILDKVIKPGTQTTATFETAGTYKYKDKFTEAKGTIIVE
ncbi:MAG: cupredoxin domain-containing protein [Nanoarchaeota archaeon]|nr:cupredoxin domain-containing protein [Nanoarchaeota archaeon]